METSEFPEKDAIPAPIEDGSEGLDVNQIRGLIEAPIRAGTDQKESYCLIANLWLNRWKSHVKYGADQENYFEAFPEPHPGPIQNSSLGSETEPGQIRHTQSLHRYHNPV